MTIRAVRCTWLETADRDGKPDGIQAALDSSAASVRSMARRRSDAWGLLVALPRRSAHVLFGTGPHSQLRASTDFDDRSAALALPF